MPVKYLPLFFFLFLFVVSCSQDDQFPAKRFERADQESVVLTQSFISNTNIKKDTSNFNNNDFKEFDSLMVQKTFYDDRNPGFNLNKFSGYWNKLKRHENNFNFENTKKWIEYTGFLLEVTGDGVYADELEETVFKSFARFNHDQYKEIESLIVPWIYTKNVDHIQVNLFVNSTIKYEHTLKGAVEISQETSYPESGKVKIQFKMENKRYIELYIRIPAWAENISIVEKGVKYVAIPGTYSQIVRKWKEGDVVEIEFTTNNRPAWMK
jgi:hypothetical protein